MRRDWAWCPLSRVQPAAAALRVVGGRNLQRQLVSLASFTAVGALVALVAASFAACSGESEGERCSLLDAPGGPSGTNFSAGSSDCAGDDVCWPAADLGGAAAAYAEAIQDPNFGICCPQSRAKATTGICSAGGNPLNDASIAPPEAGSGTDTGVGSEAGADAGDTGTETDATSDGPAEAATPSSDAATDAPVDAPPG
jgi:hypothetical protein